MNFNSCMNFGNYYTNIGLEAKENPSCNPQEYTPCTPNPNNHYTVPCVQHCCAGKTVAKPLDRLSLHTSPGRARPTLSELSSSWQFTKVASYNIYPLAFVFHRRCLQDSNTSICQNFLHSDAVLGTCHVWFICSLLMGP